MPASAATSAPSTGLLRVGTRGRGGSSPSVKARCSSTASHTRIVEARKWIATVHHNRCVITVMPPMRACTTTPAGITQARASSRVRPGWSRNTRHATTTQAAATATTTNVSSRFPYSTHWLSMAYSGCSTGVMLPGKHCGQVGHPSPDPVTRTIEPVTPIPPWVMIAATARAR